MRWHLAMGVVAGFGLAGFASTNVSDLPLVPSAVAQNAPAQNRAPQEKSYPLACYQVADDRTTLGRDQAMRLCAGAATTAPVDCFLEAERRLTVSEDYNITLCQCAPSVAPVDCFERSQDETDISEQNSLQMCNARVLFRLDGDCRPI